jgi:hypothetical protein
VATKFPFENQLVQIPGVYATIKSGIKNPAVASAFGNVLVIDNGSGAFYGGGGGIAGTLANSKDALYSFDNVRDFQSFINGGLWWLLSQNIFVPGGAAQFGASSLTYVRAAATTPASITYNFDTGDSNSHDEGGQIVVQVRDEGYVGNGVLGDETRAQSTFTLTNVGTVGTTVFTLKVGTLTIATYTTIIGDTSATIIAGLVASIASIGLVTTVSSTSTQIVFQAIRGAGATLATPTVTTNASGAGNCTAFSGGVVGTLLTRGYAAKMIAGVLDTSKFIIQFYRGTFKGLDSAISNGDPFDFVSELNTTAQLVTQTPEITTMAALIAWMNTDATFNTYFKLASSTTFGSGAIVAIDLTHYSAYNVATGGTETFSNTNLNLVLDNIADQQYDFILADAWGDNARSTNNLTIQSYINTARVKPDLYVGGGLDSTKWSGSSTSSNNMAIAYNSQYVQLIHGGVKIVTNNAATFKSYASIYKAALLVGRAAGLQPQIPLTFKAIGIDGELHNLTDKEVNLGLNNGVLMTRKLNNTFAVVKGVNTLQNNSFLVNSDGSTPSAQLARIIRQLNKELINNLSTLLQKPDGSNRNTLSAQDVIAFVQGYLNSKIASDTQDNIILSFQNVTVKVVSDSYQVTYAVVPNFEVSVLLVTGFLLDPATN